MLEKTFSSRGGNDSSDRHFLRGQYLGKGESANACQDKCQVFHVVHRRKSIIVSKTNTHAKLSKDFVLATLFDIFECNLCFVLTSFWFETKHKSMHENFRFSDFFY